MRNRTKGIILMVVLAIIVLFIFKPFTIIDSGCRGLKFTLGELNNEVLDEGARFKLPILQTIKEVTIQPVQMDYQIAVGDDGAITKDNQNVGLQLTLFFRYIPEELPSMWRDVGLDRFTNISKSAMKEAVKQEIGKYTIFEIAPIQEQIRRNVFINLKSLLSGYPVELTELRVTNYDWPDSFETQIEKTMERAQLVKQKQQDLLVAEQEAQKQVKEAEAQKTAMITVAEGEKESAKLKAEAKALEGEGIRKYNESIQKNMELEVKIRQLEIDRIKAERWDGQNVPNNVYSPIPLSTGGIQGVSQSNSK